jgi:hypothetical protein
MSILVDPPTSKNAKYFYLVHFVFVLKLAGRSGHSKNSEQLSYSFPIATSEPIGFDNISELTSDFKEEAESRHDKKFSYFALAGFSELQPPKKKKDDASEEFHGGNYRVIDKSMGEVHEFDYRHEAVEFYEAAILEHGEFREYELVAVISQHQPPEMLNLEQSNKASH